MKKIGLFLFDICFALQMVAQEQNYFTNPVIRGDVPDPSVIRIEDTYYATGTSSEWAPFYPMFTSKDLVNWKQIVNCITRPGQLDYAKFKDSGGVWAPTIRCYKGRFYVTAAIDGMGNMIMHTDDINGEWSAPV